MTVSHSLKGTSPTHDTNVTAEVQASLQRLLTNESINRAPRLRAVLKFMIDALLEGKGETINEQLIGEAVFNRPTGYNPGDDNIVRVTMRHLRDRIDEYYRTDGRDERYVFEIPKGRYTPVLRCLETGQSASPVDVQVPFAAAAEQPDIAAATGTARFLHRSAYVLPWILVGLLAATVVVLGFRAHRQDNFKSASRQGSLLSLLLANGSPTTVVVADSNLQAYRTIFGRTVPLDAYINGSYLHRASDVPEDALLHGVWNYVAGAPQTTLTSMIVASEIQAASSPKAISIKHPRSLSMRDIEHGNYVFLGGPWINPWEQLFEGRLNFRVMPLPDAPWASSIHNMNPLSSEQAIFAQHQQGPLTISYVRFALLKNSTNDGYFVLLSGTAEEAVEAGERFLTSKQHLDGLLKTFKVASLDQLPSIEVVIETTGVENVPENFRIVAERVVRPQ